MAEKKSAIGYVCKSHIAYRNVENIYKKKIWFLKTNPIDSIVVEGVEMIIEYDLDFMPYKEMIPIYGL